MQPRYTSRSSAIQLFLGKCKCHCPHYGFQYTSYPMMSKTKHCAASCMQSHASIAVKTKPSARGGKLPRPHPLKYGFGLPLRLQLTFSLSSLQLTPPAHQQYTDSPKDSHGLTKVRRLTMIPASKGALPSNKARAPCQKLPAIPCMNRRPTPIKR